MKQQRQRRNSTDNFQGSWPICRYYFTHNNGSCDDILLFSGRETLTEGKLQIAKESSTPIIRKQRRHSYPMVLLDQATQTEQFLENSTKQHSQSLRRWSTTAARQKKKQKEQVLLASSMVPILEQVSSDNIGDISSSSNKIKNGLQQLHLTRHLSYDEEKVEQQEEKEEISAANHCQKPEDNNEEKTEDTEAQQNQQDNDSTTSEEEESTAVATKAETATAKLKRTTTTAATSTTLNDSGSSDINNENSSLIAHPPSTIKRAAANNANSTQQQSQRNNNNLSDFDDTIMSIHSTNRDTSSNTTSSDEEEATSTSPLPSPKSDLEKAAVAALNQKQKIPKKKYSSTDMFLFLFGFILFPLWWIGAWNYIMQLQSKSKRTLKMAPKQREIFQILNCCMSLLSLLLIGLIIGLTTSWV